MGRERQWKNVCVVESTPVRCNVPALYTQSPYVLTFSILIQNIDRIFCSTNTSSFTLWWSWKKDTLYLLTRNMYPNGTAQKNWKRNYMEAITSFQFRPANICNHLVVRGEWTMSIGHYLESVSEIAIFKLSQFNKSHNESDPHLMFWQSLTVNIVKIIGLMRWPKFYFVLSLLSLDCHRLKEAN